MANCNIEPTLALENELALTATERVPRQVDRLQWTIKIDYLPTLRTKQNPHRMETKALQHRLRKTIRLESAHEGSMIQTHERLKLAFRMAAYSENLCKKH